MNEKSMNDAVTMRSEGSVILGRIDQYDIERKLGGGGFGSVYLASDRVAGIKVAIKGLSPLVNNNMEEQERIRENFALVSRLHHPHISAALCLHKASDVFYDDQTVGEDLRVSAGDMLMVMAFAPGVTLSQWRRQFPKQLVPLDKALLIVHQIADALDYAHSQSVLHRDIKPSNVMIETKQDGSLITHVLDFGLAAELRSSMGRVSREIHDTSGTRPYMAPEQWRGAKQGPATDQYALAAVFYEMVFGAVPFASAFECGDPIVMMTAVCNQEPELPECPHAEQLRRALSKNIEDRFCTCLEFAKSMGGGEDVASASISEHSSVGNEFKEKVTLLRRVDELISDIRNRVAVCTDGNVASLVQAIVIARKEMKASRFSRCREIERSIIEMRQEIDALLDQWCRREELKKKCKLIISTLPSYITAPSFQRIRQQLKQKIKDLSCSGPIDFELYDDELERLSKSLKGEMDWRNQFVEKFKKLAESFTSCTSRYLENKYTTNLKDEFNVVNLKGEFDKLLHDVNAVDSVMLDSLSREAEQVLERARVLVCRLDKREQVGKVVREIKGYTDRVQGVGQCQESEVLVKIKLESEELRHQVELSKDMSLDSIASRSHEMLEKTISTYGDFQRRRIVLLRANEIGDEIGKLTSSIDSYPATHYKIRVKDETEVCRVKKEADDLLKQIRFDNIQTIDALLLQYEKKLQEMKSLKVEVESRENMIESGFKLLVITSVFICALCVCCLDPVVGGILLLVFGVIIWIIGRRRSWDIARYWYYNAKTHGVRFVKSAVIYIKTRKRKQGEVEDYGRFGD